ncbi:MAG: allose kinase [Christensenellaceae bacterium]|nr:allose kinase [Christensenellaceae bacterium]
MSDFIFSMDIGGTNIRSGFVDEKFQLSDFEISSVKQIFGDNTMENLCELIKHKIGTKKPKAIALGFPSAIDKSRKVLLSTPNIKGLDNINVVDYLESKLNIPTIIDRDVNFLFEYDCYVNNLHDGMVLGFYIGTGLGNVIAVNGKILYGKNGVAAELGHIPTYGMKDICTCGNEGCAELFASGKMLAEIVEKNNYDFKDVFVKNVNDKPVQEFIDMVSIPIATEITILDPDYIIIGGGVTHMEGFPIKKLEERIVYHTRKPFPANNLSIMYSEQNQQNGVIGGAIAAFKKVNK